MQLGNLTPKGLFVLWGTNRLWTMSIHFRFFETLCKHAPWNTIRGSTNFIIFGPMVKSYGCLKILGEVWVGRACVGAN
jgi:hypothetical protein